MNCTGFVKEFGVTLWRDPVDAPWITGSNIKGSGGIGCKRPDIRFIRIKDDTDISIGIDAEDFSIWSRCREDTTLAVGCECIDRERIEIKAGNFTVIPRNSGDRALRSGPNPDRVPIGRERPNKRFGGVVD